MSAQGNVVPFISAADAVLDLIERICEIGQRLDALEQTLVEAAGADPLAEILARLDRFENRLAALELRQRRPVPLTVIENHRLDPDQQQMFNELQRLFNDLARREGVLAQELSEERRGRRRGDRDLNQQVTAFNARLDRCAAEFVKMRARVAATETRTAGKGA
jgi:hypothetical protein